MPEFDKSQNSQSSSSADDSGGYDKLLAKYDKNTGDSTLARSERATVSLKNAADYESALKMSRNKPVLSDGSETEYRKLAGTDLSSILYPFETKSADDSPKMPSFEFDVQSKAASVHTDVNDANNSPGSEHIGQSPNIVNLLPYSWDNKNGATATQLVNRHMPESSGDAMSHTISSEIYHEDVDRLRDPYNIRSIGLRLPAVGVGWGFTARHGHAWPSGNSPNQFKGDVPNGWQTNPDNYIAAPIDLRYDVERNVWAAPRGFWAEVTEIGQSGPSSSGYSWIRLNPTLDNGNVTYPTATKSITAGAFDIHPAFEVNDKVVPSGTKVWLQVQDRTDSYFFQYDVAECDDTGGTPQSVGQPSTSEGPELALNDNGWNCGIRLHPSSGTGVEFVITTRVMYDHTSNETLYGFTRRITVGKEGRIIEIGQESRYTIDVPEDC